MNFHRETTLKGLIGSTCARFKFKISIPRVSIPRRSDSQRMQISVNIAEETTACYAKLGMRPQSTSRVSHGVAGKKKLEMV